MVIYDDSAYERGTARRIARNREIGRAKRAEAKKAEFLADAGNAELLHQLVDHAMAEKNHNGFLNKMLDSFNEWGSLTEKQIAAVQKVIADRARNAKKRAAENSVLADQSDFIAREGERLELEGQLIRKFEFLSGGNLHYYDKPQTMYGQIFQSASGDIFAYFGKDLEAELGQQVSMKATVKRHEVRDGVKQTIVSRPFKPQIV